MGHIRIAIIRALLVATLLAIGAALHGQAEWPRPNWEKVETVGCRPEGKALSSSVGKYEVRVVPIPDTTIHDFQCQASLVEPSGTRTLLLKDWDVSVYQGTGNDVFGDGNPSLIVEGDSGGAHCCFTYLIASLGERPLILPPIENQTPFFFFKDAVSGKFRIMTSDGDFDYFDGMCHACTPFPRVVLQVDDDGLHDVSSHFVEQYDSEIALARAKIAQGDIAKFLIADFEDARKVVLEIVFSYLYSGRETQAWQTLDEMWPAGDRERVKKLILSTRAKGLLSKIEKIRPTTASYRH
jgi:hypothetical protein